MSSVTNSLAKIMVLEINTKVTSTLCYRLTCFAVLQVDHLLSNLDNLLLVFTPQAAEQLPYLADVLQKDIFSRTF